MRKHTEKNNRMTHIQIKKACDGVGRSEQRVEAKYCEIGSKNVVTRYASEENRSWRTVPTGYEY